MVAIIALESNPQLPSSLTHNTQASMQDARWLQAEIRTCNLSCDVFDDCMAGGNDSSASMHIMQTPCVPRFPRPALGFCGHSCLPSVFCFVSLAAPILSNFITCHCRAVDVKSPSQGACLQVSCAAYIKSFKGILGSRSVYVERHCNHMVQLYFYICLACVLQPCSLGALTG